MALHVGGRVVYGALTSNPSSPNEGDIYWNSSNDKFLIWNGSAWQECNNPPFGTQSNPATDPFGQLRNFASGNYFIQPQGQSLMEVQVNNTDNGGGWVLAAKVMNNSMDHWNTGSVNISGTTGPRTNDTSCHKLSDSYINAIRSASSYTGSTAWWMQSNTWSSNNSYPANTFVKTGSFSFHATDSANGVNDKTILTNSFEGSFTDTGPNTGTRGLGDHHTNTNFFAWVRHPESSGNPGFRQDQRGNASGYLWVK